MAHGKCKFGKHVWPLQLGGHESHNTSLPALAAVGCVDRSKLAFAFMMHIRWFSRQALRSG